MSTMIYGITIVFAILKLADVIAISWTLVFLPLMGYFGFFFFLGIALGIQDRIERKKMMKELKKPLDIQN